MTALGLLLTELIDLIFITQMDEMHVHVCAGFSEKGACPVAESYSTPSP